MPTSEGYAGASQQQSMITLEGRTALVTGGSSGIGLAIAQALARLNAKVIVLGRSAEKLEASRAQFAPGRAPRTLVADVRDRSALERVRDTLKADGERLHILVANAGMNVRAPALTLPDEGLRAMLDTNLYGSFVTLQVLAPLVLEVPGGRIILTGSVIGKHSFNERAAYAATKAGLSSLARSLAIEWGPRGATVNAVAPGIIRTPPLAAYIGSFPERARVAVEHTPLGRVGEPEDVADVVAFIASESSRFMTGQTICVDGGLSAGSAWW